MTFVVVVVYLQESKLDAVVDTTDGMRRRIEVKWTNHSGKQGLPRDWVKLIEGEVAYQQQGDNSVLGRLFGGGSGLIG